MPQEEFFQEDDDEELNQSDEFPQEDEESQEFEVEFLDDGDDAAVGVAVPEAVAEQWQSSFFNDGSDRARAHKRWRNPLPEPPSKKIRAEAEEEPQAEPPSKSEQQRVTRFVPAVVHVEKLLYTQCSIRQFFQCGRCIHNLVEQLIDGTVSVSDHFLRLSVFERTNERTNTVELRCKDNRRLWALKEYAKKSKKRVMAHCDLFDERTVMEVRRYIANSDATDGNDVILREPRDMNRFGKKGRRGSGSGGGGRRGNRRGHGGNGNAKRSSMSSKSQHFQKRARK